MKFLLKLILTLIILIVIGLGVLIFYPNLFLKGIIEDVATEATKSEVTIKSLDYSIFDGDGNIQGFKIDNPQGFDKTPHLFSVSEIEVNVDSDTVFEDVMVIDLVKIVNPSINYEQSKDSDNVQTLQANIEQSIKEAQEAAGIDATADDSEPETSSEQKFIIKKFILQGAEVQASVNLLGKNIDQKIALPDLVLTDLGEKSNGATAVEIAKQLFDALSSSIRSAFINSSLGDLFNLDNLNIDNLKKQLTDTLNVDELKNKATEQIDAIKDQLGDNELLNGAGDAVEENVDKAKELLKNFKF